MIWIMVFGFLLCCYAGTSFLFFKYPTLLHKKKNVKFRSAHISHRGGAAENYENTMTAFKHAVDVGTDMLELDCHLTKDGKVVVAHDANLTRVTGSEGNIKDFNYADLPQLKKVLPIDFLPGTFFNGTSEDRKFPLLQEVFTEFPNTPINLDVKSNDDSLITKISDLIRQHNRSHLTVWGNFNDVVTRKCFKENPDVCLLFSVKRTLMLLGLMYTGLLPFVPLKETHLETFIPAQAIKLYQQRTSLQWWQLTFAKIANVLLFRPCLFRHLEARGIQTYVWVLNNEEEFKMAFEAGVTGVMTDYPSKLTDFLSKNPQYTQNSHKQRF